MSFRTRLTSFFVLIVVVPMVAVGFLVFRLIGDSEQGKADARASGLATAAASLYEAQVAAARADARTIAREAAVLPTKVLRVRIDQLKTQTGLARITVQRGRRVLVDVGDRTAIAQGSARLQGSGPRGSMVVSVSNITASEYANDLASAPGVEVIVRQGRHVLSSTLTRVPQGAVPNGGSVTIGGVDYRAAKQSFVGFGGHRVSVTVLSDLSATASSVATSRLIAAIFIALFLLLAFGFSVAASRALQGQISRFLEAARRLGAGDFSSRIPTDGHDDFAALGGEFNSMSVQLEHRLGELSQERGRLRESIRRIGQTLASNLDRPALLALALNTAVDAVEAERGRLSVRANSMEPLAEAGRVGSLAGNEAQVLEAERAALRSGGLGEAEGVVSVALGEFDPGGKAHGVITVGRSKKPFTDDDRDLLRSLAAQTTLALENIELHFQVRKQAVTDELTGLANHGRFQDLLTAAAEQVRRYHHPLGLIMLDIDDFKHVNDTYGHQQGDVVLRHVAQVLRENSREADTPARYGGEEMALILPHTDLDGSYAIAERVRSAIEGLSVPRLDQQGTLSVTASVGVAAASDGHKERLIADADSALYSAKRQGKNRTVRASSQTANVVSGE